MAGCGAGLSAESQVKALIDNNGPMTPSLGISMRAIGGNATLRNSGNVTGKVTGTIAGVFTAHAVSITARNIGVINSGAVRGGLNVVAGLGLNLLGQSRNSLVNSGNIQVPSGAILTFATGSGGRVLVTNTGKLVSNGTAIDVLGEDGTKVDNSGASAAGSAVLARSANGVGELLNSGVLTNSGTTSSYRITSQVTGTRGSILTDNSGRLQGGDSSGISASMVQAGGGDVTVRDCGEVFVVNGTWGVSILARKGTATVTNLARINSDGGGLFTDSAKAVIYNRSALDVDGNLEAIKVRASGMVDSFAQVVNSGAILPNEKSVASRAIDIGVTTESSAPEWGRIPLTHGADTASLGTHSAGALLTATRTNVLVDNRVAIRVQRVAIETPSSVGNVNRQNTGALTSTLQHGVLACADRASDILINNTDAITAQVSGVHAKAAGGVAERVNRGALSIGTALGITAGGIRALSGRVALLNEGDITMSSGGSALTGYSTGPDSDVRISNHGTIAMGNSNDTAIVAAAGYGHFVDRSGVVHINNQSDTTGGRGAGIDAFGELSVVLTNNRLINTGGSSAILMRTRDSGLGALFNDRSGQMISDSAYAATVMAWHQNDIVINAGVITHRSSRAGAEAIDFSGGSAGMELERGFKIIGVVDGGVGIDTLRWADMASAASPGRFKCP
jgi:hypothetical protein